MIINSVEQSPVQQTGSLQASPHQFCSWVPERSDCQQQDSHSASMTLKKKPTPFFFSSSSEQRPQALLQENWGSRKGEWDNCRCTTWTGLSGTKSVQLFQTRRRQMTLALSCPLTYTNFGRGQVKNNMTWSFLVSAWYLLIYYCSVSTCSHLGQKKNIKKTFRQKAEWTSVLNDIKQLAAPVPRGCYAQKVMGQSSFLCSCIQ